MLPASTFARACTWAKAVPAGWLRGSDFRSERCAMASAAGEAREFSKWLVKAEPEPRMVKGVDVSYSLDAMEADGVADWDGVRNYAARNIMRDSMKEGDEVFYYHSNCKVPGIVGIVKVHREGYPDECAWDPADPHYDAKSDPANPRWFKVDLQFVRRLRRIIPLHELKADPALADMALISRGRLSVQPVREEEWQHILSLENREAPPPPPPSKRKAGGSKRGRSDKAKEPAPRRPKRGKA